MNHSNKLKITYSTFTFLYCVILLSIIMISENTNAQYFGRNKIQYEKFDFRFLQTENFRVYHYPAEAEAVQNAALMLERWNARFSDVFSHTLEKNQSVVLYANHADFQQTNVIEGFISQGTGGVTEGLRNRIVLPFTGVNADDNHVLGHELVHAFQYEIIKASPRGLRGAGNIPLWTVEGMAEYLSIGRVAPQTSMWMRDAVLNDDVPSIDDVSKNQRYFPYRYGHAIWAYIGGRWGDKAVINIFKSALNIGLDSAISKVINIHPDTLSKEWVASIKNIYGEQIKGKTEPQKVGKNLITEGDLNIGPSLSPDGKYVAFLSTRNLFTVDLFMADAQTGKVIKQLVSSNTDRHFEALQFMNSAGAWSPDGKLFAFIVLKEGDNEISVLNIDNQNIIRNIKIPDVNGINHVSWAPDGKSLVISGTKGGISDLYLYNYEEATTVQLTDDNYSDIQPVFSPDGKTIAFVTDRGTNTNFENLIFGNVKIGLMEIQTRNVRLLSFNDNNAKHITPYFSSDGSSLYFISDPDGISNIYRYSFTEKSFYRLTNIATGISGLTEVSPAFSVASQNGRLAFTVFQKNGYKINTLEADETAGELYKTDVNNDFIITVTLPPQKDTTNTSIVSNYLLSPTKGLPATTANFALKDYSPRLGLLAISDIGAGVVLDRFGTGFGGGVSMVFSDLLGDHILYGGIQASGSFKDIGGEVYYENRKRRLGWGAGLGHIPYQSAGIISGFDSVTINGRTELVETVQLVRQRIFSDQALLRTIYPLTINRRWEFSAAFTRISYDFEAERILLYGDQVIGEDTRSLEAPSALNLFQSSLAYVGDYSYFGFTSPISGKSYRFEVEPTFGSLQFLSLLLDYRNYLFWNPFTFAVRMFHYGRYLSDAESNRLSPLILGYDTWVRGYDINSIDISECEDTETPGECPEFDRLVGSKIGVFNAEFRIPLFGVEQFGLINFPYIPTEISFFFDGGIAWTDDEKPVIEFKRRSRDRIPIFSTGIAARINLLGYLIGQVYYAYPFQRPERGAHFGFHLSPGW